MALTGVAAFDSAVLARVLPLLAAWSVLILAFRGLRKRRGADAEGADMLGS
jgi:hypothetical protein